MGELNNHNHSFRNNKLRNSTSLSQLVHELKDKGVDYVIQWDIVRHAVPYRGGGRVCNLCICESYEIIRDREGLIKSDYCGAWNR